MHRHPAAGGYSGVGNNTGGGGSLPRDNARPDFTFSSSPAFALSSRRPAPLTSYKLKCEHEPLSARLGPPDFYPPTFGCLEEQLTREACQNGYKEVIDGVEESKELSATLAQNPSWNKSNLLRYKESVRKRLRDLNNIVTQKRKAGQVYGVPLTGSLLARSGQFPVEFRPSGEDHRKKWVEDLAQPKRLKALSEHVPYGLRKHALFEALIKHGVPFLRASWSIKVIYLNQVRPMSIGMSSGGPDKSQQKRAELWTKDVLEFIQLLLDEICVHGSVSFTTSSREPEVLPFTSTSQQAGDFSHGNTGGEEPSLQEKWRYMARLLQLHHSEGLLHRVQVVEWIFKQLQERDSLDALVRLLPMVFDVIDVVSMSQTYVRLFVEFSLQKLAKLCPGDSLPEGNGQLQHYAAAFLVDIMRYLIMVVSDTFVALDCFPLPRYIGSANNAIVELVTSVQSKSASLAKAVNPALLRNNSARVIWNLDKALSSGDVGLAFKCVFDGDFCSRDQLPDGWLAEVSPWFDLGPGFLRDVDFSDVYAVHFLCEWAVCKFRDSQSALGDSRSTPQEVRSKLSLTRDMSRVYMVVAVLNLKMEELKKKEGRLGHVKGVGDGCGGEKRSKGKLGTCFGSSSSFPVEFFLPLSKVGASSATLFFKSPGLIHDMVVTWVDRHQAQNGDSFENLQLLLYELVHKCLFWPPAYARQLIVSGILEKNEGPADIERAARHKRALQHLPCPPAFTEEDRKDIPNPLVAEALRVYRNERHFVLTGFQGRYLSQGDTVCPQGEKNPVTEPNPRGPDWCKKVKRKRMKALELKHAIGRFLCFPPSCLGEQIKPLPAKRPLGVLGMSLDGKSELTPGCEECFKNKRQRLNDGRTYPLQLRTLGIGQEEENEMWWKKKVPKNMDNSGKGDLPKPPKQTSRGRPKAVRKLSLSQLASARIETSEGTMPLSSKVHCPFHKPAQDAMLPGAEAAKPPVGVDLRLIGASLKRLRVVERRLITRWLDETVRRLVDGSEKLPPANLPMHNISASHAGALGIPSSTTTTISDERSWGPWHLGEDQLATVLYLMDIAMDYERLAKLLIWLLPKALMPAAAPPPPPPQAIQGISASAWNKASIGCDIGEAVVLSGLRRYESIVTATNLIPEAVSAAMIRVSTIVNTASGGRVAIIPSLAYVRDLYKKYRGLSRLLQWEKTWKASADQWLVAELDSLKAMESEPSYGAFGMASSGPGDDRDNPTPPRIAGRTRVSAAMKDIVQTGMSDVTVQLVNRERELALLGMQRSTVLERWNEGFEAIHRVVFRLVDFVKQSAGTLQSDSQHAFVAVSAMVNSAGSAAVLVFDSFAANSLSIGDASKCVRLVLRVYLHGLLLLKEAFGERHSRAMESAVAYEASSIAVNALGYATGRSSRPQFQMSPEIPDPAITGEFGGGATASMLGKPPVGIAAVASLVLSLVVHGVCDLDRLIQKLKIKDGLEALHLVRNPSSNSNGTSRAAVGSMGGNAEASLFWFRVLIGDCRHVASGLVQKILGDSNLLAFSRIQHLQPLSAVLPPTYALFTYTIRRQYPSFVDTLNREDNSGLVQGANNGISEVIAHEPFRHVCLRDMHALYAYLSQDTMDHAKFLDMQGTDIVRKAALMVPLRARLFLHCVLDRNSVVPGGAWDAKDHSLAERKLVDRLVRILDDIQPAAFHWQWLELRLLLNEQVLIEKLHGQNVLSAEEAVQALSSGSDNNQLSESEKSFTEIILTRLLVRPDAALLYSEVVSLLGRPLEEYLILQVKWVLENNDMLLGRKSLQQQLEKIAQRRGFDISTRCVKAWGWLPPSSNSLPLKDQEQSKPEAASLEEGEVAEEGTERRKDGKLLKSSKVNEAPLMKKPFAIEKALADLALPCLAHCAFETRCSFAFELVKQLSNLEQHLTPMGGKGLSSNVSVAETAGNRNVASRRAGRSGLESGSPAIGRKFMNSAIDPYPSSNGALQTSMWLRLQFLLPLLPLIYLDRDTSCRNMRWTLAPVLLRLLAGRVVQETIDPSHHPLNGHDSDWHAEAAAATAAAAAGEGLFDRLLNVFHALLSESWVVWLKRRIPTKDASKPMKEAPAFDRDTLERMQGDVDCMQLPPVVRVRLQAAMPMLPSPSHNCISAGPPQVPVNALYVLQPNLLSSLSLSNIGQKVPYRIDNIMFGKVKPLPLSEPEMEMDPWTLLEDGTGSGVGAISSGSGTLNNNESGSLKACSWLKGAVRMRRTDLTYVGAVDDNDI